jgi:hypothetical protein
MKAIITRTKATRIDAARYNFHGDKLHKEPLDQLLGPNTRLGYNGGVLLVPVMDMQFEIHSKSVS